MEETEEELVPFARIVEELGWPAYKVRLALGKAGQELRGVKATRRSRRTADARYAGCMAPAPNPPRP